MKRPYLLWYFLVLLLAFTPVGLRVWAWRTPAPLEPDGAMVQAGETLFNHDWTSPDPLSPSGDGLGPVYNATSCVACHHQGGAGGSGGLADNVTVFTVLSENGGAPREGVVHAFALKDKETLADVNPALPHVSRLAVGPKPPRAPSCGPPPPPTPLDRIDISQRNTPALFGAQLIDAIPDRIIIARERAERLRWGLASADGEDAPVGRAMRLVDGRIGKFGWKGQTASLADFVQAACANELGLGNPGHTQPAPLGNPCYQPPGLDLTLEQCNQLTSFIDSLPRPVERLPDEAAKREEALSGKKLFGVIGCADCHVANLGSVAGLYSDLLLHRMGLPLVGGGSYGEPPPPRPDFPPGKGPHPSEWRTPPLWGVADSAPYLHDGRAKTLEEAITLHDGQAARSARRFGCLTQPEKTELIAFLKTLRAP